jgi:mannose-1-phosphate guanylyltransferase
MGPITPPERTLVLTNASLADAIAEAIPDLPRENIIAEPKPAGTAAALTYASALIAHRAGRDAVMLCVHADWAIGDAEAFRATLLHAAEVAERERGLVTVGIVPSRPDPGFGYIEPGPASNSGSRHVARFVEKPSRDRAAEMCDMGYLWNSGIFVWRVEDFLDEVRNLTLEVAPALAALEQRAQFDTEDLTTFFNAVKSISVDVGVLERSKRIFVIPGNFGWDDVGTWASLRRVRTGDATGNVIHGDVHILDAKSNVVHAEGNTVVLYGVSDLVVVTRNGLTLITTVDKSTDLKTLIDALPTHINTPQ